MSDIVARNQTILVVGGGISGMNDALEAAEVGKQVIAVEKRPFTGGRVSQLREGLNKSILDFSDHETQKFDFCVSSFFNGVQPSKMAARPCAAEALT